MYVDQPRKIVSKLVAVCCPTAPNPCPARNVHRALATTPEQTAIYLIKGVLVVGHGDLDVKQLHENDRDLADAPGGLYHAVLEVDLHGLRNVHLA